MDQEKLKDPYLGVVKWFGGYSYQKGGKNDYGFIQSMSGEDVYVHLREIQNGMSLSENELVIFKFGKKGDKVFAKDVYRTIDKPKLVKEVFDIYKKNKEEFSKFFNSSTFQNSFKELINEALTSKLNEKEFIRILQEVYDDDYQFLFDKIDDYISQANNINNDVFQFLLTNLEKINYKNIIQSKNIKTYLSDDKVKAYIIERLSPYSKKTFDSDEFFSSLDDDNSSQINKILDDLIDGGFLNYSNVLLNYSYIDYAFDNIESHKEFFDLLKKEAKNNVEVFKHISKTTDGLFKKIVGRKSIKSILDGGVSIEHIPYEFLQEQEEKLYSYIQNKSADKKKAFLNDNIEYLPTHIILLFTLNGIIDDEKINDLIEYHVAPFIIDNLTEIVENKFRGDTDNIPDYVNTVLDNFFKKYHDYSSNKIIRSIIEPLLFKSLLYDKKPESRRYLDQSLNLSNSIEYYVLGNIFPLLVKNDTDTTYKVFLDHLWEAIKIEQISIKDDDLFKLFPSCEIMGHQNLSCEAFYWQTHEEDIFLCRGSPCADPQVLPGTDKHFLDYNIYDWFKHYNIDYIDEEKPSKKDFPIKLAGYFNRLSELYEILKCRECNNLMMPDMRYAKVQYYEYDFDKDEFVKKNTSAAYRVTVFQCKNSSCGEFENKYYINHCLGFGCYRMIDSRDLKRKCDNGLYICKSCGSCCEDCAKDHPTGFCPDCGSDLNLFEKDDERFVYCSKTKDKNCSFKISSHKLTKKFYSKTMDVKNMSSSGTSFKGGSSSGSAPPPWTDDDLPFF